MIRSFHPFIVLIVKYFSATVEQVFIGRLNHVLFSSADETLASGQMDQFKTRVVLNYTGSISWYSPTILRSRCGIDIEFFPFDDQKCEIKFASWTYNGLKVDLRNRSDTADLASYMESGEFSLISAKAERGVDYFT